MAESPRATICLMMPGTWAGVAFSRLLRNPSSRRPATSAVLSEAAQVVHEAATFSHPSESLAAGGETERPDQRLSRPFTFRR